MFFENEDNNIVPAGNITTANTSIVNFGYIDYKETDTAADIELGAIGSLADDTWNLTVQQENTDLGSTNDLSMNWRQTSGVFNKLGVTADTDEAADLVYGGTNIGTKDEDHLTEYGIVILEPKASTGTDKVTIQVPGDLQKAEITIGTGEEASTASAVDLVTASEDLSGYTNLVLVGGPAVNSATAEFMGLAFPAYGDASNIAIDTAIVKFVEKEGQTALIVAGWEKADTQRAATTVAAGGLAGESMVDL